MEQAQQQQEQKGPVVVILENESHGIGAFLVNGLTILDWDDDDGDSIDAGYAKSVAQNIADALTVNLQTIDATEVMGDDYLDALSDDGWEGFYDEIMKGEKQ